MTLRTRHVVLAMAVGLSVMNMTLVGPVLPDIAASFAVSLAAAGGTVSAYAFGRFLFRFGGGVLADRYGSRRVGMAGSVLVSIGALLAATTTLFPLLMGGRVIQGVGTAMFAVSAQQYLLVITPRPQLGRATAILQTGIVSGAAVGPLFGGILGEVGDWTTAFYAQVVVGVVLVFVASFGLGDPTGEAGSIRGSLIAVRLLLRRRLYLYVGMMGGALFFMRAGGRNALLPLYADRVVGLGPRDIGFVVSASSVTAIAVTITAGRLTDSIGRKPVAIAGSVASALTVAAYAFTRSFTGMLIVSALAGLTITFASVPIATMVGDLAPAGTEGVAAGVHRMAVDLGWIVGPLVLGGLADLGAWSWGFVLAGVPLLLLALGFLAGPETKPVQA